MSCCRFHVYQYVMYTLAMWNSYLFVSALDIFVVVLAGFISIFSARRSQRAIEKVCLCLQHLPGKHCCCFVDVESDLVLQIASYFSLDSQSLHLSNSIACVAECSN